MLLGSLTNYLQNQGPLGSSDTTDAAGQTTSVTAAGESNTATRPTDAEYQPSTRAILISAIAAEIDVENMQPEQLGGLQQSLQQYGLINQKDLMAFSQLRSEMQQSGSSAIESLNQLATQEQGYQSQQSTKRLQALFHNLASARTGANQAA